MIQCQHIYKTFRVHKKEAGLKASIRSLFKREWIEKHALKDVSLQVGPGEILGLVGANGAGKTTLVKILAGIVHPTAGDIKVLGHRPFARHNDFRRQIALIMGQKAQLWWDLPAADGFLLLKEIYRIPAEQYRKTLDSLVSMLDVGSVMNIQLRRLSLGERMKMELIAALLHAPKVVFLDEPTIGLDLNAQQSVRKFLLEYRREHKPAMILTSHYMEDIERLCERIVIMREGSVVYDGGLAEIVASYTPNKVVQASVTDPIGGIDNWPTQLGEAKVENGMSISITVPRAKATEAAGELMRRYPINDLNILEEDISNVIASLLHQKNVQSKGRT